MKKSELKQLIHEVVQQHDARISQAQLDSVLGKTIASASFAPDGIQITFTDSHQWLIQPKIGWLKTT